MAESKKEYKYEIYFQSGNSKDNVLERITKLLKGVSPNVTPKIKNSLANNMHLTIVGNLTEIEKCKKSLDTYFEKTENTYLRLNDEASDEARAKAYPILANVEQQLRIFINRSMLELYGFNWWEDLSFQILFPITDQRYQELKKDEPNVQPIELTLFEELIEIVQAKFEIWSENRQITVGELMELLKGCQNIEQLKEKLEKKTEKFLSWENVFSKYFQPEQWKQTTELLNYIIKIRNKVMHHRPFNNGELKVLQKKE